MTAGVLWCVLWFNTLDAALARANLLGPNPTVQFVVAPSTRNIGGWLGQPYGLVWRVQSQCPNE
jgi:hypothetical protein